MFQIARRKEKLEQTTLFNNETLYVPLETLSLQGMT